ncbi:hypothetical protein [Sphingobium sp. LSP13-1-1.1]|uniref:hypothetical protein n=1 Tax=Sphingobium sp. LSP13-1-1.1 TaxID=3135234 RepID=UPI00341D3CD5
MAHFMISYDLHNGRNYQPLWNQLQHWGAVRLLESLWIVSLTGTAIQVRDVLNTVTDSDDSVAVIEVKTGSMWATRNCKAPGVEWLKKNIG